MSRPGWRGVGTVLLGLVLLSGLVVTAGYFYLRGSLPDYDGDEVLMGLDAEVTVWFDRWAIPTIVATDELDLFRAQGWVHASERLWQMEMFQRIARGQLAELFGEQAIDVDRLTRTLDLWGAAAASLAELPEQERRLLDAYAEGVNRRIDNWDGPLPPEFVLLRFEPQPWSAQASVAIGKIMALDLSGWRTELARIRAEARLPAELAAVYAPAYPAWGPTILQDGPGDGPGVEVPDGGSDTEEGSRGLPEGVLYAPAEPDSSSPRAPGTVGAAARSRWDPLDVLAGIGLNASNAWAVDGSRSADGVPLLANDMHLALRAPSTWYLAALHADSAGVHVAGLTIPGSPGVVVGYNPEIAWGFTNGMVDDADFVAETLNLDHSGYATGPGEWTPFERRTEVIEVRGGPDDTLVVRETVRGPVISDVVPGAGLTLSLVWTGRRPSTEAVGLLGMNRATSVAAFRQALAHFTSPHQNVIYATGDEIGYQLAGSVPVRARVASSAVPASEFGPAFPAVRNAPDLPGIPRAFRGFLASANNLQSWSEFGRIGVDYPVPFRARRIVDRLQAGRDWTFDSMLALQRDVLSLWAARWRTRAVEAARRADLASVADTLAGWDLRASTDSRAAPLFYLWLYGLRDRIAADQVADIGFFPEVALTRVLETADSAWVDDVRTPERETLAMLEEAAMIEAAETVGRRNWGEAHVERSVHMLGRVPWLDRLFRFNVGPYPGPGGPHTVRPDSYGYWTRLDTVPRQLPVVSEYGPSERFIVRMGAEEAVGRFLLPTGQSGNPLSAHYRDMADRWTAGELIPVSLDVDLARLQARARLVLEPVDSRPGTTESSFLRKPR